MYGKHQGYSYQDLIAAILVAENLHKKDFKIAIELKENGTDLFDDIVIVADGFKNKYQVKHSAVDQEIARGDLLNKSSNLNISKLSGSYTKNTKQDVRYTLVTNRKISSDSLFKKCKGDGSFSFQSSIYSINAAGLKLSSQKGFIRYFNLETSVPSASFDLNKPGSLEKELLEILRSKVGIGYYPNNQISERDVAGRLILFANKLRLAKKPAFIDRDNIFADLGLNFEYGHVAQEFPFISSEYRLHRNKILKELSENVKRNAVTILEGPPGSGKSHVFDDLIHALSHGGCVAHHFCYLEPTDKRAQERIVADAMYGNFIHQLEQLEPELIQQVKPYFAATKTNLEKILGKLSEANKQVVLMIDGLDHLGRVVAQNKLSASMVNNFLNNIFDIKLPKNCFLFIASQPSSELNRVLKKRSGQLFKLQPWDKKLIEEFARKHNENLPQEHRFDLNTTSLDLLTSKTEGNPLYLTYILKEIVQTKRKIDLQNYLQNIPQLSSDLNNYYKYLLKNSTQNDFPIVQTLALLDFSVSSKELAEMFPPIQRKAMGATIKRFQPILKPGVVQSGIRIYHESFRRFIIESAHKNRQKDSDLYKHITEWLERQGFFISQRAYRYLIPYLIRSGNGKKSSDLLKPDFIIQSLYYFHSVESITENLNKVADFAAHQQRWEVYCRAVEFRRSLHTFSEERLDSVDDVYHQAILNVHGPKMFCERLLFDGKPVFSKAYGILLCQMAEHAGGNPPWNFYDAAGISMQVGQDHQIRHFQRVEVAHFLNMIRRSSERESLRIMKHMISRNKFPNTEEYQIRLLLKEFDYVFSVSKNREKIIQMRLSKRKKLFLKLEVAGYLQENKQGRVATRLSTEVLKDTLDPQLILRALLLGGRTDKLATSKNLEKLTNEIIGFQKIYDSESPIFREWYQILSITAYVQPSVVKEARKLVKHIDGWYRAWILYLFDLALIESSSSSQKKKEERLKNILEELSKFTHPFRGTPRAMDLYSIRALSSDSFKRTLLLAKGFKSFPEVLNQLSNISRRTTSYLQGSSDGPLSGEEFNSLLKEVCPLLDEENKKAVRKLLEENVRDRIGASVYYDSSAFEYLKLATILAWGNKSKGAKERLLDGCTHLGAYGHRKDVTLYEIIEPIPYLAKKHLPFAISALRQSYPLVETVWRYTDGKSTIWSLNYWLESLIDSDIKVGIQGMTELITIDPVRDWRIERGTEYLCGRLMEIKFNPIRVAELYKTIHQANDSRIDVSTGLKIADTLAKERKRKEARDLFDHTCRQLYLVSVFEYVSDKSNYSKLVSFADKHKFTIKNYDATFRKEAKKATEEAHNYSTKEEKVPRFSFAKLSLRNLADLLDKTPSSHVLHPKNAENFGYAIARLSKKKMGNLEELILLVTRRSFYSDVEVEGLIKLRDALKRKGCRDMAAFVSMLGFIYIRGGNGWHSLADSKYNYLASDAFTLSPKVAKSTFADEMSYVFSKASYFTGPVRHLIELFSTKYPAKGLAQNIWTEAYGVIKLRLPMHPDLEKLLQKETPTLSYNRRKSINSSFDDLLKARQKIIEKSS